MKTKQVNIKTKKVMIQYNGKMRSMEGIERIRAKNRIHSVVTQLHATVPAKIKDLLIEQARIEGLNMSAMIGQVLVNYLLDQGTKIEA